MRNLITGSVYKPNQELQDAQNAYGQFEGTPYLDLAKQYYNSMQNQWRESNLFEPLTHRAENFNDTLLQQYYNNINNLLASTKQDDLNAEALMTEERTKTQLGLNTALTGLDGSNPGSAPVSENAQLPEKPNVLSNIANTVTTALSMSFEMYAGLQGIKSLDLDNDTKAMGLVNSLDSFFINYFANQENFQGSDANITEGIDSFLSKFKGNFSRRNRPFIENSARRSASYVQTRIKNNENLTRELESRGSVVGARSFFEQDQDPMDKVMEAVIDPIINLQRNLYKSRTTSSIHEHDYSAEYYEGLDPTKASNAQNMQNELSYTNANISNNINKTMADITSNLSRLTKDGNWAQKSFAYTTLVSMWLASAMNFNVSAGGSMSKIVK